MKILKLNDQETINFACIELKKYLENVLNEKIEIIHRNNSMSIFNNREKNNIIIGTFNELKDIFNNYKPSSSEDEIWVKPYEENLVLTGSNQRSILYSVYALLKELGISWIYPGKEGEIISRTNEMDLFSINVHHKASLKYRGIILEGAVKFSQILDFIDWMAKMNMNHFFMQFQNCYNFYKWYDSSLDEKSAKKYDEILIKEIKKRGMILERVGHGWISKSLGIEIERWEETNQKIPVKKQSYLAKVNGKRALWEGIALNTQMCMSNKEAVGELIDYICNYAKDHKEIDILSFGLGDGFNNLCECENCMKHNPTDLYIRIVNQVADKLFKINPKIKLEVLIYANILEPPLKENIENPKNNIIFMFAPITRCLVHALNDDNCISPEPIKFWPDINKIGEIKNREYIKLLKGWLKKFNGDIYVTDYYNCLLGSLDFIKTEMPKIISMDIKYYNSLGLKGILACGTERTFWPTGIAMNVFADISWDSSKDYEKIEEKYLKNAFKEDANIVREYIHELYNLIVNESDYSPNHNYKKWYPSKPLELLPDYKGKIEKLDEIIIKLKEKKPWLEDKFKQCKDEIIKKRWFYFLTHLDFLIMLFETAMGILKRNKKEALSKFKEIQKYLERNKQDLEDVLDIFELDYYFLEPTLKKILEDKYF
jgi:hypothetical protein